MLNEGEVLLVSSLVNVNYLTDFDGSFGWCLVWRDGDRLRKFLITDARYKGYVEGKVSEGVEICDLFKRPDENLKAFVEGKKLRKIGFEAGAVTVKKLKEFQEKTDFIEWVAFDDVVEKMRMIKNEMEIDLIMKSQEITKEIFKTIKHELAVGMTEMDVAWRIECLAREKGCGGLSFTPIVAFNEHSACPHHKNTDRKFKDGDLVLVDMGVVWKGYCSDMTRMIFTGEMTAKQREVYGVVEEAQKTAIEKISAGMTGVKADAIARDVIKNAGFGKEFCHSLGHGVGLEIHEKPTLSLKSKDTLEKGMVVTVEPGIYLEGEFGVRIEDLVVVN